MVRKLIVASIGMFTLLAVMLMASTGDKTISLTSGPTSGSGGLDRESEAVVYDNGMTYTGMSSSQIDVLEPFESEPADDFIFSVDQLVNDVHWVGGYWNGPPDDGDFDWRVSFYLDFGDGTKPGALMYTEDFPNAATNETLIAAGYFNYSVNLAATLNFVAGEKYWVSIQGIGNFPPQSGWASHDAVLWHETVFRSAYFGYLDWTNATDVWGSPQDQCFQLTYTPQEGCDWNPGDPYKHHFPQLPDETGWAVNATEPMVLAEDFMCMETGWIKDFHFWGAWKNQDEGQVLTFVLSIHEDIPAGQVCVDTTWATGDCNGDGIALSVADLTCLIDYIFGGGTPPVNLWEVDLNGDCIVDQADVVVFQDYFVNGLAAFAPYGGYPVPACCTFVDGYSRPGLTLWEMYADDFSTVPIDPPTYEGWYDPATGEVIPTDHLSYWKYNICLDESMWFWQDSGTIYWVNISAIVADPLNTTWGWKSTQDHWNDDAVWAYWSDLDWIDIWEPTNPIQNQFWIGFDPFGNIIPAATGGIGYYGNGDVNGWWYYEQPDWQFWNIWFYDHPFDYNRKKEAHIEFDIFPVDPAQPSWVTFVVNYSTDIWSLEGQPPGDSMPPLPGPTMPPDLELQYIGRDTLYNGPAEGIPSHMVFDWEKREYNPEWISIDVWGYNFIIPEAGIVFHDCIGSLDLSLVVTGGEDQEPIGACCYDDAAGLMCIETTQDSCINVYFGDYQGDGTTCQGMEACCFWDGSCMMADALCCVAVLGGTPQGPGSVCAGIEACCMPDGSCVMVDALCCVTELFGIPQGAGTACTAPEACCLPIGCQMLDPLCCDDLNGVPQGPGTACSAAEACCLPAGCVMLDPLCCLNQGGAPQGPGTSCSPAFEACCFPDGSCLNHDPLCCVDQGGTPQGPGTVCLGDLDGNTIDDACESAAPNGACCFADGSCLNLTQIDCAAAGGVYMGDYTMCAGDADTNGVDDACEEPWFPGEDVKMHFPQMPDEYGWDVDATWHPIGDDFECTETGTIRDIHFWGSWRHGITGNIVRFDLAFYGDAPAGTQAPWSMPLDPLWVYSVNAFVVTPIIGGDEGWLSPVTGEFFPPPDHNQYFQYDIYLPEANWFEQDSGTVYWLVINAIVESPTETAWGWKTSRDHWNDDGVWIDFPWLVPPGAIWTDLLDPLTDSSLDLAFAITGTCCIIRGDVDHLGGALPIDVADLTYLVAYLFTGGPPPPCLSEANVDGIIGPAGPVDVSDLTYLVAYLFLGGPPPVPCP